MDGLLAGGPYHKVKVAHMCTQMFKKWILFLLDKYLHLVNTRKRHQGGGGYWAPVMKDMRPFRKKRVTDRKFVIKS